MYLNHTCYIINFCVWIDVLTEIHSNSRGKHWWFVLKAVNCTNNVTEIINMLEIAVQISQ